MDEDVKALTSSDQLHLDYSLQSPEERNELVAKIIAASPPEKLTPKYLEMLADYLIFAMDKKERKEKKILTDNRLVTVNRRETSYEGLCGKLENGEDGIYNMISDLGKNALLTQKDPITESDVEEIPELKELRETIAKIEELYKNAHGKKKYLLKKQIIEMRQDQYVIRNGYRRNVSKTNSTIKSLARTAFDDCIAFDSDDMPYNTGLISFFNPAHIEALLCNYSSLREAAYANFEYDLWYIMEDLDSLVDKALKDEYPLYYDLLIYKIDGLTNAEIQNKLEESFGIKHSIEYLSALWRNKIPKLIADTAIDSYLNWYYSEKAYGTWKRCGRCGEFKLANKRFYSKNCSSKDGWYSICKECRNAGSKKNLAKLAAKQRCLDKKA